MYKSIKEYDVGIRNVCSLYYNDIIVNIGNIYEIKFNVYYIIIIYYILCIIF